MSCLRSLQIIAPFHYHFTCTAWCNPCSFAHGFCSPCCQTCSRLHQCHHVHFCQNHCSVCQLLFGSAHPKNIDVDRFLLVELYCSAGWTSPHRGPLSCLPTLPHCLAHIQFTSVIQSYECSVLRLKCMSSNIPDINPAEIKLRDFFTTILSIMCARVCGVVIYVISLLL